MDMFNGLRHEAKLKFICEEVMTLALERRLSANSTESAESAYADALEMYVAAISPPFPAVLSSDEGNVT
jgi:hypothetical protein